MNKRVLLGMSGGVDSSVAAILLQEQGYEVIGITMKLWEDKNKEIQSGCCSADAALDAKKVCGFLNIPHYTLDFQDEFQQFVIQDFICQYQCCRTPNPCIECNKYLKFGVMYRKAQEIGCDYIATGHYAKTFYHEGYQQWVLAKSNAVQKDQSYVLYPIPGELLDKVLFPLGDFADKKQVRKLAQQKGLQVSHKPDSEDICFIPDGNYKAFLEEHGAVYPQDGNIVKRDGTILGKHHGLYRYTIGQRRGLGIAYSERLFVVGFRPQTNELIVGTKEDVYEKELYAHDIHWLLDDQIKEPKRVRAKIRYSFQEADAILYPLENGKMHLVFEQPQKAVTPGQSVVFYDGDIILGGGKIL